METIFKFQFRKDALEGVNNLNEVRMVPFKDEDCERFMEQEVKPWIEENVTDFAFDSYDGKKLQAYCAIPEKPKKALVFVHGFC